MCHNGNSALYTHSRWCSCLVTAHHWNNSSNDDSQPLQEHVQLYIVQKINVPVAIQNYFNWQAVHCLNNLCVLFQYKYIPFTIQIIMSSCIPSVLLLIPSLYFRLDPHPVRVLSVILVRRTDYWMHYIGIIRLDCFQVYLELQTWSFLPTMLSLIAYNTHTTQGEWGSNVHINCTFFHKGVF